MATKDEKQIDQLIEEISSIKMIINRNKSVLKQILLPAHFRLLSLMLGISIILFSILFSYFINHYESYKLIPGYIKGILLGAIAVDWLFLVILKYSNWFKSILELDYRYTIGRAMKEFFSFRVIHVYLPLFLLGVFLVIYLLKQGSAYYIIPTISIATGLMYNFIGSIIEVKQYLLAGYWLILTGIGVLLFNTIPAPIALSISVGCGMLIFAIPIKED